MSEHAVIVRIPLKGQDFGSNARRREVHELADRLEDAVATAEVGEYDGNEFGDGVATLYFYGPDADTLFAVVEEIFKPSDLSRGASINKRYGGPSDTSVPS